MRFIVQLPLYALIAGGFLVSGCVVEPDHDHDRGYQHDQPGEGERRPDPLLGVLFHGQFRIGVSNSEPN